MAEKHTHGADASSSEDEFVDFEDDGWLEQYTSEDEGECFTTGMSIVCCWSMWIY